MKLVLDTNVYISAFLWGGKPKEILERAIEGKDEVFISRAIKDEIFEVLKRPRFKVNETAIEALMREIEDIVETGYPVDSGEFLGHCGGWRADICPRSRIIRAT